MLVFEFDKKSAQKAKNAIRKGFEAGGVLLASEDNPLNSITIDDKVQSRGGFKFKTVFVAFKNGQSVQLSVKLSQHKKGDTDKEETAGDVFEVKLSSAPGKYKTLPIKNQDDHEKAIAEIAKAVLANMEKFKKASEAVKVTIPKLKGVSVSHKQRVDALKSQIADLDTQIAVVDRKIESQKEVLAEAVRQAVAKKANSASVEAANGGRNMIDVTASTYKKILQSTEETKQILAGKFSEDMQKHLHTLEAIVSELNVVDRLSAEDQLTSSGKVAARMRELKAAQPEAGGASGEGMPGKDSELPAIEVSRAIINNSEFSLPFAPSNAKEAGKPVSSKFYLANYYKGIDGGIVAFGTKEQGDDFRESVYVLIKKGRESSEFYINRGDDPSMHMNKILSFFASSEASKKRAFNDGLTVKPYETTEYSHERMFNEQIQAFSNGAFEKDEFVGQLEYSQAAKSFLEGDIAFVGKIKSKMNLGDIKDYTNIEPKPIQQKVKPIALDAESIRNNLMGDFVSDDKDVRYYLRGVMVENGRMAATNGQILIEVKTDTSAFSKNISEEGAKGIAIIGSDGKNIDANYPRIDSSIPSHNGLKGYRVDGEKLLSKINGIIKAKKYVGNNKFPPSLDIEFDGMEYAVMVSATYAKKAVEAMLKAGNKSFMVYPTSKSTAVKMVSNDGNMTVLVMPLKSGYEASDNKSPRKFKPIGSDVVAENISLDSVGDEDMQDSLGLTQNDEYEDDPNQIVFEL
jgi:hypothetical protein